MLFQVLCGLEPIFYTTHPNEEPEIISNYFAKMNQMYDLKTAVGVEVYINHMKKEM